MNDYIDYTEESTDSTPDKWTHQSFKRYFIDTFHKVHKVGGGVPWSMKQQVLLKTMIEEYPKEDLVNLILFWHTNTPRTSVACEFTNLYCNRVVLYEKMKKVHEDYTW